MRPSESLRIAGQPMAYFPRLAKPLGGTNAAILFSHFFYWNDKTGCALGVYKTAEEIERETGLTQQEQRTARQKLREKGILLETYRRIEHRIYYKLDLAAFDDLLRQYSQETAPLTERASNSPELQNQHSGAGESTSGGWQNQHSYKGTEDYQKITAKDYNNKDAPAASGTNRPSEKPKAVQKGKANRHTQDLTLLAEYGITGQLAEDYLAIRKAKRQPLTQTAMTMLAREAQKVGMTAQQAVLYATEQGWGGFRAEYLQNRQRRFDGKHQAVNGNRLNEGYFTDADYGSEIQDI